MRGGLAPGDPDVDVVEFEALGLVEGEQRDGVVGEGIVFDVVEVGLVDEGAEEAEEAPHLVGPDHLAGGIAGWGERLVEGGPGAAGRGDVGFEELGEQRLSEQGAA